MSKCPLCGLEIRETELSRHYLQNKRLIDFIRKSRPGWTAEIGACAQCLEDFSLEWTSQSLSGHEISEERTVITASDELIEQKQEDQGVPALITIHGGDLGKKFNLTEEESILGRGEQTHIRVNEENVSRQHAKFFRRNGEVIIEDLQSTNGTFVNTRKITSQPLKDGDLILIGNTILKFVSGSTVEKQYHEEIYRLATIDGLTQIFNKNTMLEKLADEFSRSRRYKRDLALLLLDFDHFKNLNDTFGHPAGDFVLKKTANMILRNMRKEDVCGRYGGEEIGIILPETPAANAQLLAEKIRKLVEGTNFNYNDQSIPVTISLGVAAITKETRDVHHLLERADQALYAAKGAGRNCVRVAP